MCVKLGSYFIALSASFTLMTTSPIFANDGIANIAPVKLSETASLSPTVLFKPRPKPENQNKVFDYQVLSVLLDTAVLFTGASTRIRAGRVKAPVGTRIKTNVGHTSPYRQEGNKIRFSSFNDEYKAALTAYQKELEAWGNQVDITALSRNEQLAYWFNLHNVTILDRLSQNYPVRKPRKLLVGPDKVPLHDADIISIKGTKLSLRDIREKIVFQHWKDPNVIYGFFRGDLGSPSLQGRPFSGRNVSEVLNNSAYEFTNSLRGIDKTRNAVVVSRIFYEAAPYYFPDFSHDLKAHLRSHLRGDVVGLLDLYPDLKLGKYQAHIADLTGGVGKRLRTGGTSVRFAFGNNTNADAYLSEFRKNKKLWQAKGNGGVEPSGLKMVFRL